MTPTTSSTLQVLILSAGVYLVLGFLRTSRGTGLVRGLAVAALVGVLGLYVLAKTFELNELHYLFEVSSGYVVIVLAILFQQELRRGIVHLGENPLLGRLLESRRLGVLTEIVQAVGKMATKRQGALIAIERKMPLDAYMESAVRVDAEVDGFLLDTIFHHGSALHDGAVIIRGDRVAAAGCLFPLAEEGPEITKSTGTRHRAAIGLTEETDALTIAVSEETGAISLAQAGSIERRLSPQRLEELLRERLGMQVGGEEPVTRRSTFAKRISEVSRSLLLGDPWRKLAALAIALGLFGIANRNVRETTVEELNVVLARRDVGRSPTGTVLMIVLPGEEYHLGEPLESSTLRVEVSGTRAQFEDLGGPIGGILRIDADAPLGTRDFPLEDVRWGSGNVVEGLSVRWRMPIEPKLSVQRYETRRFSLNHENLQIDTQALPTRYSPRTEEALLRPSSVQITGPVAEMEILATEELPLRLAPVVLSDRSGGTHLERVGLSPELEELGFAFQGRSTIELELPIRPAEIDLGPIEKEIRLVALTGSPSGLEQWQPLTTKARFMVRVVGIIPTDLDPSSEAWIEKTQRVTLYVEDHLQVFVDAGEAAANAGSRSKVLTLFDASWRDVLPEEMGASDPEASLELHMISDPEIHLIAR